MLDWKETGIDRDVVRLLEESGLVALLSYDRSLLSLLPGLSD